MGHEQLRKENKETFFEKNFFFRKSESSFRALYHRRRITLPLPSPPTPRSASPSLSVR